MASTMNRYGETLPPQAVQLFPAAKLGLTWKKGATFFETTTSRLHHYLEFIPRGILEYEYSFGFIVPNSPGYSAASCDWNSGQAHPQGAFTRDAPLRCQATSSLSFSTSFITYIPSKDGRHWIR
jgi:hypothetical protein